MTEDSTTNTVSSPPSPEFNGNVHQNTTQTKASPEKLYTEVTVSDETNDDNEDDNYDRGSCGRFIEKTETFVSHAFSQYHLRIINVLKVVMLLLYMAYFSYCMYYRFGDEGSIVLLVGTIFFVLFLCNKQLNHTQYTCSFPKCLSTLTVSREAKIVRKVVRYGLYVVPVAGLCVYLVLEVLQDNPSNSQSIIGIFALILICFIFSKKPSKVNWHPIIWGFIIQFAFAMLTIRTEAGYQAFKWLGDVIQTFLNFSDEGSIFVFGENFRDLGNVVSAGGIVIFFNSIIFLLNHWGVIDVIVVRVGGLVSLCMELGPVESVSAVANIFMGLAEAPMFVRPYLATLSRSELCAIMTCGFASISGAILGLFIRVGAPANHLLTASVISAPAALAFSKLACPETERVNYAAQRKRPRINNDEKANRNALRACTEGAQFGVKLLGSIAGNLLAMVSILAMLDAILTWFGERAGVPNMTFDYICSYVLYPLAYVMGADPEDCRRIGSLIGVKMFATPLIGYSKLGDLIENRQTFEDYVASGVGNWSWAGEDIVLHGSNITLVKGIMSERSEVIATYAMCGFSAFPSIGMTMGLLIPMSPSRKQDIIDLVMTAFFAGNMASFATGAVAGLMFSPTTTTTT